MARQHIILMTDDFDGTEAAVIEEFVYQGVQYICDLTDEHAEEFREFLALYMNAAHESIKVTVEPKGAAAKAKVAGAVKPGLMTKADERRQRDALRAWCAVNGVEVGPRRISQAAIDAYAEATGIVVDGGWGNTATDPQRLVLPMAADPKTADVPDVNGITPAMRQWARDNDIPMSRGYLKKEFRDQYAMEQLERHANEGASLNGAHV